MSIIESIARILPARSAQTTPAFSADDQLALGEGECCAAEHGTCPLARYAPEEIGLMRIPDMPGPRSRHAYCLGLAAELLRRADAGAGDDALLSPGPGDGRHRACIARVLASKGAEVGLHHMGQ